MSEGCYLLRTNLAETDPALLWKRYIQLTEAEWALPHRQRRTGDPAGSPRRPADRVKGHILVCFLAYAMWKTLGEWMRAGGLGDAPRTVLEEFARVKSGDVRLPTCGPDGRPGRTLRVRCVTTPDEYQRVLLSRLGIRLPERLRYLEEIPSLQPPDSVKMWWKLSARNGPGAAAKALLESQLRKLG